METDELLNFVGSVRRLGHPDPAGFVARSRILTGLKGDNITGITDEQLAEAGFGADASSTDRVKAAVAIDLQNMGSAASSDLAMAAFHTGTQAAYEEQDRAVSLAARLKAERDSVIEEIEGAPPQPSVQASDVTKSMAPINIPEPGTGAGTAAPPKDAPGARPRNTFRSKLFDLIDRI